ncbi:acyl-[acyl-carrier-protein] desaturase [Arcticibacter tournemirensis]|uniref:Acyl-ACP desaturase n=1 Tax=Arcticibacter tournemirensis TaxID=699437 RepID=A0A5M9H5S3_9SPHI|nr:acyl-ACP desaturase [Arcticibacter tournemirensis]KAA8482273.1 acyl-ACP desaturase [Arcticibacter tournemirensis]TQM52413.1 acyl-[acyl-carrier-protein] desaturase [Arcticibacter tournemirensis]
MNNSFAVRREVMQHIEKFMLDNMNNYLKSIDTIWQPSDFLPDSTKGNFFEEVKELRESAKGLSYDLLAVLIGDTITEEALPTYESWLTMVEGVSKDEEGGWMKWVRHWTSEENRHGDLLNKYLYLSGRVNMRQLEVSTQYLLADGFDIGTDQDPYRNFIYTSFQELATNISHRRVASLAKRDGDTLLSKMCGVIASDEARHARAYKDFISEIIKVDPNEVLLAFEDMMRKKIVMPAHFLRELGKKAGETFTHFADAAQRLGVYTSVDYVDILKQLINDWEIEGLRSLNDAGEKARDYLMKLPDRLSRIAERMKNPTLEYQFKWIHAM